MSFAPSTTCLQPLGCPAGLSAAPCSNTQTFCNDSAAAAPRGGACRAGVLNARVRLFHICLQEHNRLVVHRVVMAGCCGQVARAWQGSLLRTPLSGFDGRA